MASNIDQAKRIVQIYTEMRQTTETVFLSYKDLAIHLGRPGEHRLLGGPLDLVRDLCDHRHIPDVATMIVSKASLLDGTVQPSKGAVEKYGGWPDLRKEQARAMAHKW